MALNPYTLYHLYDKGILEYVPTDLMMGTPMGAMMPMSNPYLDMAMQGGLYQNHGMANDSFQMSGVQSPYVQNYQSNPTVGNGITQIGALSNAGGLNTFNGYGVGTQSAASIPGAFGFNGNIGAYSDSSVLNTFNGHGVGSQSQAGGLNTFGGFTDTQNNISGGFNKMMTIVDRTPKVVLGLFAGAIGIGSLILAFKKGKKPATTTHSTSFWSKLNPKNWFKKK